jgi:hypothetical protein
MAPEWIGLGHIQLETYPPNRVAVGRPYVPWCSRVTPDMTRTAPRDPNPVRVNLHYQLQIKRMLLS